MIKATISNETKRNAFAKTNNKKIASAICSTKCVARGVVLNNYKIIASGVCADMKNEFNLNNIIAFKKQKEVA
ncbi:MAG: hypothetical protein NC218_02835 [Acetobacter sp.]|nr:hypothetical protein [Acetobacter sp.]